MKKFKYILLYSCIFSLLLILSGCIYKDENQGIKSEDFIKNSKHLWAAYFAGTNTEISYGNNTKAKFMLFNEEGGVFSQDEKAYFNSNINYFDEKIYYQNSLGVKEFNSNREQKNVLENQGGIGYDISGSLQDLNLFYFLVNRGVPNNSNGKYLSYAIIGNSDNQVASEIEGFITTGTSDRKNLYFALHDEGNKNNIIFKKFKIDDSMKLVEEKKNIIYFDVFTSPLSSVVYKDYLYVYVYEEKEAKRYLLKFSKNTLELLSKKPIFTEEKDSEYVFVLKLYTDNEKIYFMGNDCSAYEFNPEDEQFRKLFLIERFDLDSKYYILMDFDEINKEFNFFYKNNGDDRKYNLIIYDLKGNQKESLTIEVPKSFNSIYPHSFKKIK